MNIYAVYDLREKEQCVRIGTLQEIVIYLNLTVREIDSALRRHKIIRKRYEICYLFSE